MLVSGLEMYGWLVDAIWYGLNLFYATNERKKICFVQTLFFNFRILANVMYCGALTATSKRPKSSSTLILYKSVLALELIRWVSH